MPKMFLHLEGLVVLVGSTFVYFHMQYSWIWFVLLLFAPDLSALAYMKNTRVGSLVYNVFHTYTLPAIIFSYSWFVQSDIGFMMSIIWIAHIGMDRMVGYGLKYPTTFQDTHFRRM